MRFKLLPVILLAYAVVMASADENDPSSPATDPSIPPTVPSSPATDPSSPPTAPSSPPTVPSSPATDPSSPPTVPSSPPTVPSSPATNPSSPPTVPSSPPTDPSSPPTDPSSPPTDPSSPPTDPSSPPTDPSSPPTDPSSPPTDPSSPPTDPSSPPTDPSSPPTDPSSPATDPSSPATKPSSPATDPSIPATEASSSTVSPNGWDDYPIYVPGEDGKPPCIFSKMNISLTVTYEKKDNKNTTSTVFVPEKVSPSGSCNDTVSIMILSWAASATLQTRYAESFYNLYADEKNEITFHFKKDASSIKVSQIDINIFLDSVHYPDAKSPRLTASTGDTLNLFATSPEGKKYVCNTETVVSANSGGFELTITDVNLIAFNTEEDLKQISEENCMNEEITESANVGAIVGGIIAALVVVGIVGFIIWRRRRNSYAHSEVP